MNWADYVVLAIVGFSAVVSVLRGFVREALALAGWVAALWVAIAFMDPLSARLADQISVPSLRAGVAFFVLFAGTLMANGLLVSLVGLVVERSGLSGTDRSLGVLFGIARGVVIVGLLVLAAGLTRLPGDSWWSASLFVPHFERMAREMRAMLPPDLARRFRFR